MERCKPQMGRRRDRLEAPPSVGLALLGNVSPKQGHFERGLQVHIQEDERRKAAITVSQASKLDTEKLRKLRALMQGGKTEGERIAAKSRAEALAVKSGMTLSEALSKLDAPDIPPRPKSMYEHFVDRMEECEPGWKARRAAKEAEREAKPLVRCRELLKEFGSEEAVFAETPEEAMLMSALHSLPLPETVPDAWNEYQRWETLTDNRCAFEPYYSNSKAVHSRLNQLEHLLDTLPSPNIEGIRARMEWLVFVSRGEFLRREGSDASLASALLADFDSLVGAVQFGHRRSPERRAQIWALLRIRPKLSDREIARRVGCSPQTVGNIRRRASS